MARRDRPPKLKGPEEMEPAYEVGYGKPPKHTRFQKGQSGNPNGRPRGAGNKTNRIPALNEERMKTVVLAEAYRLIGVRDGDRLVEIPVIQAVIRAIAANAAKGHHRSQQLFGELVQWVERENKALHDEWLNTAIEYKRDWEQELYRRERAGATGPEPLPHPDDIVINIQTGQVEIRGPMTREEKIRWDQAREYKAEHDAFIEDIEEMIKERPKDKNLPKMLTRHRKINASLHAAIGPYAARLDEEERQRLAAESSAVPETGPESAAEPRVVRFTANRN